MGRAILEIDGDVSGLRAAFLSAREESARVSAAIIEDSRRVGRAQREAWRAFQRVATEALANVRRAEEEYTAEVVTLTERRQRAYGAEVAERRRSADEGRDAVTRAEEEATRGVARASARRRRVVDEETRHLRRAAAERRKFFQGAGMGLLNAVQTAGGAFADYGDDVRTKRQAREQVEYRSTQIAAGDIGDAGAASQLSEATRRVALLTGLRPEGIIEAIGQAQANFSALASATDRGRYLGQVLPQLAQAAVASNSSLEDMVNAAGEYARQLNISNEQLPQAIAQAIAEGRLGSIGFQDVAGHMGVVAGSAARTVSSAPEDSMRSRALIGAAFQFAGRAGGSGDEAATRARAFFDNLSSGRGQQALRDTLGYNAFDASGQIARRQGETQVDAFQRIVQDTYRRSGGNSTRFLDAVAGRNTRARSLGDQLFRDLRSHGGTLTEFRGMIDESMRATPESSVGAPFRAITGTEANRRARREVREFYGLTSGSTDWARDTEQALAAAREAHPFLGRVVGNDPLSRGFLDLTNLAINNARETVTAPAARPRSRAELQRAIASEEASASMQRDYGPAGLAVMDRTVRESLMQYRTAEGMARLQLRDQARERGESPVHISDQSIRQLAEAIRFGAPSQGHTGAQNASSNAGSRGGR